MTIPTNSKHNYSKNDLKSSSIEKESPVHQPFGSTNYYMMAGCVFLIILGFLLMSGGGSSIEEGFNPDIFSTRRIVIGPLLAFLGFLFMAFAIIWHPNKKVRNKKNDNTQSSITE